MSTQDTAGTAREGMTMDETTRLRALLERATPRPWHNGGLNGDVVGTVVEDDAGDDVALLSRRSAEGPASEDHEAWANGDLIVAAVNALPRLLDAAERAERELATATASVRQLRADVELATAQRDAEACRADNAEAERDDLAATLETRAAEHALAMEQLAAVTAERDAEAAARYLAQKDRDTQVDALGHALATLRDNVLAALGAQPHEDAAEVAQRVTRERDVFRAQQAPLLDAHDALVAAARAAGWTGAGATGAELVAWVRRGEREACARVADDEARDSEGNDGAVCAAQSIAAKIRGREGGA